MVNMSLMHGLSKVGGGCPTSASSMPVNASASEQLAELASPLDVQKIPTDKVVRGTFVERMRGTSEELIGRRKKTKVSSRHRSHRGGDGQDKSESRAAKGKELASPIEETPTARARPLSMKELCGQLERASDAPLEVDLTQLAHEGQVWLDGEASATYVHATQIPRLAGDMYTLLSEVLMIRAAKALVLNQHCYMALMDQVHDAGHVITSMDNKSEMLREEIQKLKDGGNPDAVALAEQRAAEAR
ncbi:hypothetical protein BHM03_00016403 [Ensete ventricosum]|nr:hypothetical protein BHM03_00016403 [Ensete ventricosum]